jgi:transposase
LLDELTPSPSLIRFENVTLERDFITIDVVTTAIEACCPRCQNPSNRVHSAYLRHPRDLPCMGRPVRLLLKVRRFFCLVARCSQIVFTERLSGALESYARKTNRLIEALGKIAVAVGGAVGSRLLPHLQMSYSPASLLRLIRILLMPEVETPKVLGVDDWAIRKGHNYATVLVDLEKGKIIELLGDRTSQTFEKWLRQHPGVEIISRDRGGAYSKASRDGAPEAEQVADRFDLVKNLSEHIERIMVSHHAVLRQAAEALSKTEQHQPKDEPEPSHELLLKPVGKIKEVRQQRRQVRYERYQRVKTLAEEGWNMADIVWR